MNTIPIELLQSMFSYDAATGHIKHKRTWGSIRAGDIAGTEHASGYIDVKILGVSYRAHRVAWALATGSWPDFEVDHIDGVRHNNKWLNLQKSNDLHNAGNNARIRKAGGYPGVTWAGKSWCVRYKGKNLGNRSNLLDAIASRKQAEREDATN